MTKRQLQKIILRLAKSYDYEVYTNDVTVKILFYQVYGNNCQHVCEWVIARPFYKNHLEEKIQLLIKKGDKKNG